MRTLILNKHTGAVGLPGGLTLQPGETATLELSDDDYKLLQEFEHVELSDVDRPKGGSNAKPAKGKGNKGL